MDTKDLRTMKLVQVDLEHVVNQFVYLMYLIRLS